MSIAILPFASNNYFCNLINLYNKIFEAIDLLDLCISIFLPTKGLTSLSEHEKTDKNKIIKNNL